MDTINNKKLLVISSIPVDLNISYINFRTPEIDFDDLEPEMKVDPSTVETNSGNMMEENLDFTFDETADGSFCRDGSHKDFGVNLNEHLVQLAEGWANPTVSK